MQARLSVIPAVVAFCLSAFSGAAFAAPLRLTVGAGGVRVSGVTAKGSAVLFGITREVANDDVTTVTPYLEVLTDDDGDGVVAKELGKEMPRRSMWVAVDLTTGEASTGAPAAFRLLSVGWRGHGIERRRDGRDQVEDARSLAEVLVVRPGAGVWTQHLGDGSADDADGLPNGRIAAAFDGMHPVGASPAPPSQLAAGDTVVLLDPNAMEMTVARVGGQQP